MTSRTTTSPKRHGDMVHLDIDEESEVVGTLIVGGARYVDEAVSIGVTPASFAYPAHTVTFAALQRLAGRDCHIEARAVIAELDQTGELEAAGGAARIHTHA